MVNHGWSLWPSLVHSHHYQTNGWSSKSHQQSLMMLVFDGFDYTDQHQQKSHVPWPVLRLRRWSPFSIEIEDHRFRHLWHAQFWQHQLNSLTHKYGYNGSKQGSRSEAPKNPSLCTTTNYQVLRRRRSPLSHLGTILVPCSLLIIYNWLKTNLL